MADQKTTELTALSTPETRDLVPVVDDVAGTPTTKKMTILDLFNGGWIEYVAVTPTSGTLDDPSFEVVFAGVDLTSVMSVGMRVRLTQSTTKYFIITKIAFSTDTTITLYGGTDYDLVSTGTTAISAFYFSATKAPLGFPLDPLKWTVTLTDTTERRQNTPTIDTWYNVGSLTIDIPIGAWLVSKHLNVMAEDNGAAISAYTTLSTANNSASDTAFIDGSLSIFAAAGTNYLVATHYVEKHLLLASKTTYYVNIKTDQANLAAILERNDYVPLSVKAVCAYL